MNNKSPKIVRKQELAHKIIIVDGMAGCGKTLFSSVVSSFDQVELLNYAFEIEFICRLFDLGNLKKDGAIAKVRMLTDHKLYQNMLGRDVNFRLSDLSSVFKSPKLFMYLKRIFKKDNIEISDIIKKEKPILNFTTHDLLQVSEPVFEGLKSRLFFIDVVRHPLFMIIQQTLNMERLLNNPRDIQVNFEYKNNELPYFARGWEELFLKSNSVEKSIYYIKSQTEKRNRFKIRKKSLILDQLITIPFEKFVKTPNNYMNNLHKFLNLKLTKDVKRALKRQNVPRQNIVDGIPLSIYKRCGWEPPEKNLSEKDEFNKRRDFVISQGASKKSISILDELSHNYEKEYNINI